jgi:hypothetical protein
MDRKITKLTIGELNEIENSEEDYYRYCPECAEDVTTFGTRCKDTDWTEIVKNPEHHFCGTMQMVTNEY